MRPCSSVASPLLFRAASLARLRRRNKHHHVSWTHPQQLSAQHSNAVVAIFAKFIMRGSRAATLKLRFFDRPVALGPSLLWLETNGVLIAVCKRRGKLLLLLLPYPSPALCSPLTPRACLLPLIFLLACFVSICSNSLRKGLCSGFKNPSAQESV